MSNLDRFSQGLPDMQNEEAYLVEECANYTCGNPIYAGEKNWDCDGEWFCSAQCLAFYYGAERRVVE